MHRILKQYYTTDTNLLDVFKEHVNLNDFFEKTFMDVLVDYSSPPTEDLSNKIDEAIKLGHDDTGFYLLFLLKVAGRYLNTRQTTKFLSIFSVIKSIPIDFKVHKILFAQKMQLTAHEAILREECDLAWQLLEDSIKERIANQKEHILLILNYCSILSTLGRLKNTHNRELEILKNYSDSQKSENKFNQFEFDTKATYIFLFNSLITLNYKKAIPLIEGYKKKYTNKMSKDIEDIQELLLYLNGTIKEEDCKNLYIKQFIKIYALMKKGYFIEAKILYPQLLKKSSNSSGFVIDEYFNLHFYFYNQDKGKISLELKRLHKRRIGYYMIDLFYGRYQLLNNEIEAANITFNKLLANVKKFDAMNRLLFELQFCREIKLKYLIRLAQGLPMLEKEATPAPSTTNAAFIKDETNDSLLIGETIEIKIVRKTIKQYANLKAPILILGETGTGKELVARSIHLESKNYKEPFLVINCGALTDTLLESELFGYVAGAFTGAQKEKKGIFEAAGTGTVFLDEFGDISPKLQVSLLRVLESNEIRPLGSNDTKEIACKIVVATNTNLKKSVEEKKFREDLYFRLNRFEIKLPALRERRDDIPILIQHFLNQNNIDNTSPKQFSKELLEEFMQYDWPGNIRELKNEVERLYVLHTGDKSIDLNDFDLTRFHKNNLKEIPNNTVNEFADIKPIPPETVTATSKVLQQENDSSALLTILKANESKTESRLNQIRELFLQYNKLSRNQIVAVTKASPSTITNDLQNLCLESFIKKIMPTKSHRTHYFVRESKN